MFCSLVSWKLQRQDTGRSGEQRSRASGEARGRVGTLPELGLVGAAGETGRDFPREEGLGTRRGGNQETCRTNSGQNTFIFEGFLRASDCFMHQTLISNDNTHTASTHSSRPFNFITQGPQFGQWCVCSDSVPPRQGCKAAGCVAAGYRLGARRAARPSEGEGTGSRTDKRDGEI